MAAEPAAELQPQFTLDQRTFMVLQYHTTRSPRIVIRNFRAQFPNARRPSRNTPYNLYQHYILKATSHNLNKDNSGRARTGRSQLNIDQVRQALQEDPTISARRNPLVNITKSTFNNITRLDLQWHPYIMERRHSLRPEDLQRRMTYCQWLVNTQPRFLSDVLIGDEATFPMNAKVNSRNVRKYAPKGQPPENFNYDLPESREKLVVWVGLMGNGTIIGPVIMEENMTGQRYLDMINDVVVPELIRNVRYQENNNGSITRVWWFQDGAPCHRARIVRDRLQQLFPRRLVGIGHATEYPPRSPDLTPLDFYLWGFVKSRVYATPPASIQELEQRIRDEIRQLRRSRVPRQAVQAMRSRAARCIANGGDHVEGRARGP